MNVFTLCQSKQRLPMGIRTDKALAVEFLKDVKFKKIEVLNPDVYSLASWVGFDIDKYKHTDGYSEVESVIKNGQENTYDMHIKNGNSYVANGIFCHNTVNLPEDVSEDKISEIFLTAWKSGCKGITVYRDKCRDGVLISNSTEKPKDERIIQTTSPKRPTILPADIHHTKVKGETTTVLVGLLNGDPYEVMVIHGHIPGEKGFIVKVKRGHYRLIDENDKVLCEDINESSSDNEDALTRLASTALRHGSNMKFICEQLGKVKGDFMSLSKGMARVLKKYIPDGVSATGTHCSNCNANSVIYVEGCQSCRECGYSKCS